MFFGNLYESRAKITGTGTTTWNLQAYVCDVKDRLSM